jgi:cytochrome c
MKRSILAALLVCAATPALADGAGLFAQRCAGCHTVTVKSSPGGPSLKGVVGRRIAGLSDFSYSAGLKAKGGTWTAANLGAFLAAPSAFAPGSKMFVSVPAPADRAALIAYLSGLK